MMEETKVDKLIKEYFEYVKQLNETELDYLNTYREYDKQEFDIITTYDFKAEYGKDNEKIRKGHIKQELHDLLLKKDALELEIKQLQRYLKYLELAISYGD